MPRQDDLAEEPFPYILYVKNKEALNLLTICCIPPGTTDTEVQ